jgi:signal transduction histidine kinase
VTDLDTLRGIALFDGTDDEQLLDLLTASVDVPFATGDVLFLENRAAEHWWVLLSGSVDLLRHVGQDETQLGTMDVPGRWAGGFRAWDEHGVYLATGRAASPGWMLRVPAAALRRLWTARLPLGLHLVEGVSRSARNYESMARQRESLAALGTLAAGFAHELNNPAAAAIRAVDGLAGQYDEMLSSLARLAAAATTAAQFTLMDELRRELRLRPPVQDPMELADRGEELTGWLTRHAVPRPWAMAAVLARAGADLEWCDRIADVLAGAALSPGLEWLVSTLSGEVLLGQVKESTRRISDLVTAVKSYTQLDRASMQPTDLAEGLESTLVVLAHRMPAGVTVVREYDDSLPLIEALAGELNQVWTNLIDNALDAMGGHGTLRVSTRSGVGAVVVEIADTGAGMSPEARAHAFDPFFTTKGIGEGTGLGLDISRRIVDLHGGDISIDCVPGETIFRVRIPDPVRRAGV